MNKVAKVLKYGSIVFFIVSFIGAAVVSNKKELSVEKAKYSWETDKYESVAKFDGTLFFNSLISSIMGCALIYGFGELIDIEDKKRRYLVSRFGEIKEDNTAKNTINVSDNEDVDSSKLNHKLNDIDVALRKAIDNHSMETKGFKYDGVNEAIGAYYFKIDRPSLSKTVKIEVTARKSNDNSGFINVRSLTKNIDIDVKIEVSAIEEILLEYLEEHQ